MGAILFSSLLLLVFFTTGNSIQGQEKSLFKNYYSQSFSETVKVFNDALTENPSTGNIRRKMYEYDRFVKLRAEQKDIDYRTIEFFVLPDKGEAVLINYQPSNVSVDLYFNSNKRTLNVGALQWRKVSFDPGKVSVHLIINDRNIDASFDAVTPRMFNYARMERQNELWSNYRIH